MSTGGWSYSSWQLKHYCHLFTLSLQRPKSERLDEEFPSTPFWWAFNNLSVCPIWKHTLSKASLLRTIFLDVTNFIKSRKWHPLRYACHQHFHCLVHLECCITSSSCCPQNSLLPENQISQNIKWHLWPFPTQSCCKALLSHHPGTPISSLQQLKEQTQQAFDLDNNSKDYTLIPLFYSSPVWDLLHTRKDKPFPCSMPCIQTSAGVWTQGMSLFIHTHAEPSPSVYCSSSITRNHALHLQSFQCFSYLENLISGGT